MLITGVCPFCLAIRPSGTSISKQHRSNQFVRSLDTPFSQDRHDTHGVLRVSAFLVGGKDYARCRPATRPSRWRRSGYCSGGYRERCRGSIGGNRDAMIAVCSLGQIIADLVVITRIFDEHVDRRLEPRR